MRAAIIIIMLLALLSLVFLGLRALYPVAPAESVDISNVQTNAVSTFAAGLTQSASAAPTSSATNTLPPSVVTPVVTSGTRTPVCLALHFVRDVTIPDNTEMTPAQVFTKTWLVENSGTCLWKPGYQVILIGGFAMGGSPFRVAQEVGPGGTIQISIKMVSPTNQTGVVQGTWKIADDKGEAFGDTLWVVIDVVGGTPTPKSKLVTATP